MLFNSSFMLAGVYIRMYEDFPWPLWNLHQHLQYMLVYVISLASAAIPAIGTETCNSVSFIAGLGVCQGVSLRCCVFSCLHNTLSDLVSPLHVSHGVPFRPCVSPACLWGPPQTSCLHSLLGESLLRPCVSLPWPCHPNPSVASDLVCFLCLVSL